MQGYASLRLASAGPALKVCGGQGMMKTASGRRLARQRTAYMRDFLDRFEDEWYCKM